MIIIEGHDLIDLIKNINKWLGEGKTIKSIEIFTDDKRFFSHKAHIKKIEEGNHATKNDSQFQNGKRKVNS